MVNFYAYFSSIEKWESDMRVYNGTVILGTIGHYLLKLNIYIPQDPAVHFEINIQQKYIGQKTCIIMFTAALFIIAKNWK